MKLFGNYGKLLQFDFMLHKNGPLAGTPQGFCFISYNTEEEADKARLALDKIKIRNTKLNVNWANEIPVVGILYY